jgi:hypothetical protein
VDAFITNPNIGKRLSSKARIILLVLLVSIITILGIGLRVYAATRLPIDYDERVYLETALEYNNFIRDGRWNMLAWSETNSEHPPLYKILYAFGLLSQPRLQILYKKDFVLGSSISQVDAKPWGMVGRNISIAFGGLITLTLALINPLAGLAFAANTLTIKYTSTFFLEALPGFTSFLSVLCYQYWLDAYGGRLRGKGWVWMGLSAGLLGMTAASKYLYAIVGIAMGIDFLRRMARGHIRLSKIGALASWGLLAGAAFFLCDPYLWPHPVARLADSLFFHLQHAEETSFYSAWQPLAWFFNPFPVLFENARPAFLIQPDTVITILALIGLPRLARRKPIYFIWLIIGLVVVFTWPRKWPQYNMLAMIPLCLSSAQGFAWIVDLIRSWAGAGRKHRA